MVFHKRITEQDSYCITDHYYSIDMTRSLFKKGSYGYRKLSIMKQENIRDCIKRKVGLFTLKSMVQKKCGYCFKFNRLCRDCPIRKRLNGLRCCFIKSYKDMENSTTLKQFSKHHLQYCKDIGFKTIKE